MSDKKHEAQIPAEGELTGEQLEGVAGGIIVINSKLSEPPEPGRPVLLEPPDPVRPILGEPPDPVKGFGH